MSYNPNDLRSLEKAHAKARETEGQDRLRELDDLRVVMSTDAGRRVIHRLYVLSGMLEGQSPFNTNSMITSYVLGKHDVLSRIDWLLRLHCNREFALMLDEAKQ